MELRALEYFVAVAEERHFTRAAGRMHVSQSGLSATIKSLEAELRAALFERTTRRVQLTTAGAALLPEARRALAAARAGAAAVGEVQGLQRGPVIVGVMQQMGLVGLPRLLAAFHRRYPGIELRLRQAGPPSCTGCSSTGHSTSRSPRRRTPRSSSWSRSTSSTRPWCSPAAPTTPTRAGRPSL